MIKIFKKEYAHFKSFPRNMRILLMTNLIYALVLPIIELFVGAYILRESGNTSYVVVYQLMAYLRIPVSFLVNGFLLRQIKIARLYSLGMLLSGVAMSIMMMLPSVDLIGISISGLMMGFSYRFFWSNRDFLSLSSTDDNTRNYYFSMETFFYTLTFIIVPAIAGYFIASGEKFGWFPAKVAYFTLTLVVFGLTILSSIMVHHGDFVNPRNDITKILTMKKPSLIIILLMVALAGCNPQKPDSGNKAGMSSPSFTPPLNTDRFRLFDLNWKFFKGELAGAETPGFADSLWRNVDLPHDWSIEDLPNQKEGEIVGPFSKNSIGSFYTGYTIGGTGWYRKKFVLNEACQGKEITLYFDGVYMESDVWINGHHIGYHTYGYTPFYYKLNSYLNTDGQENTIAIKVKNIGENSRWYSGSGIYRHVWLRVTEPLNISVWGVYITTPEVSAKKAKVLSSISLENNSDSPVEFTVKSTIITPGGKEVLNSENKEALEKQGQKIIEQHFDVSNPSLWSIENPSLYTMKTELIADGKIIDTEETSFGIRSIHFSPETGFLLNGQPVLLKGACIHHDNGPLGAAAFDRADQRRIENLKANGFNAIRTSHNPPSVNFLNACDRLGMLVMDEAFDMWENAKRPDDYHRFFRDWHEKDLRSMLLRDRNHPSIILWSIGNEIPERADSSGLRIAKRLIDIVKDVDPTRPVTQAICEFWEYKGRKWEESAPAFALMDVCGYNYLFGEYEKDHSQFPERVMVGTESFPLSIYENWKMANEKPYVIGDFVWTGMDYLGEAGIGQVMTDSITMCWPWYNSNCGDIDLIGFKKQQSFYRDVVWDRSLLEMAAEEIAPAGKKWVIRAWGWRKEYPSWNWPGYEGQNMNVYVYSKCDEVRLELNGKVIASQTATPNSKFTFVFSVPYEPGELKAVALFRGKELAVKTLKTTGVVEKVKITSDRSSITHDRNDLAYLTIELVDANGDRVPNAETKVRFSADGEAEIAAVDNGNPLDPKSFQTTNCNAFHGRCLVILRPTGKAGKVTLTAQTGDISPEKCVIEIK